MQNYTNFAAYPNFGYYFFITLTVVAIAFIRIDATVAFVDKDYFVLCQALDGLCHLLAERDDTLVYAK